MEQEHIYTIIARYLAGEATPADTTELNDWLARDARNGRRLEELRRFWETPAEAVAPATSFETFFARIEAREAAAQRNRGIAPQPASPARPPRRTLRLAPMAAAASLALFVAAASAMFFLGRSCRMPVAYHTVACASGVERLVLPDSTVVYLNEQSRVTYSDRYAEERRVRIDGEVFFDVVKGRGTFTVEVGDGASIEVLGTRFNVEAFAGRNRIVTTLEEGSVKFVGGEGEVLLRPDQQLVYDRRTFGCSLSEVDAAAYSAWKEPVYRYASITLSELCRELERFYDVRISLNPTLGEVRVSGSFMRRDDIETILGVMEKRMRFRWKRNGDYIQIE